MVYHLNKIMQMLNKTSIRTRIVMVYLIPCAEKVSAWAGIRTRIVMVYRFGVISAGVGGFKYSYKNCYGLSPTDRYGDYWYF